MSYSSSLIVLVLCLNSSIVVGQHARSTRQAPAFIAARYLHEIADSSSNKGARVTGDVDNDGDMDLLVLTPGPGLYPGGMETWQNNGRGDFHSAHQLGFGPFGGQIANTVFLADIDGDGRLDLAYDRTGDGLPTSGRGVAVHLGLGDGRFGSLILLQTLLGMKGFVLGDCDGDGHTDILMHEGGQMAWWRFVEGSFVSGPAVPPAAPAFGRLETSLDFNGDGLADIVMSSGLSLETYRTVNLTPTLEEVLQLPGKFPNTSYGVQAGDLDGDGDSDLLTVHPVGTSVFIQPIRNDGPGFTVLPFQGLPQPFLLGFTYQSVLADWDADGDADLVSPTFSWLENTGAGQFALAGQQTGSFGLSSTLLQVADLNGDGNLDALSEHACFFGDGRFPESASAIPELQGPLSSPAWRLLEDWEGDGDLDLVDSGHLYLNNGDATFVSRSLALPEVPGTRGLPSEVAWGDFDGDGHRDLVVALIDYPSAFEGMFLFTGTAEGSYALSPTVPSPNEMSAGLVGDIDGDADLDILVNAGYWQNDGTGRFGSAPMAFFTGRPLCAEDFDGDSDLDLLINRAFNLELLTNLGGLSFEITALGPYDPSFQPVFRDLDQDGDLDLVVVQPEDGVVTVHEQLTGGGFAAPFELVTPEVSCLVGQMDVDGNGRLDLVVGIGEDDSSHRHRIGAWLRWEGMVFPRRREWIAPFLPRALGDLDRDGDGEPVGDSVFQNFRFDGPEDGRAVQYGLDAATSGTGGLHPILGSGAPVRPGRDVKLVISGGLGGASGVLLRGTTRTDLTVGGFRNLVAAPETVRNFVLGGAAAMPGAGSIVLRTPVTHALVGLTFDYQAVLFDPGAIGGLSATNGLEIRYGDWPDSR